MFLVLEDQMLKNLASVGLGNVAHAHSIAELNRLLNQQGQDYRGIIVTMIHKSILVRHLALLGECWDLANCTTYAVGWPAYSSANPVSHQNFFRIPGKSGYRRGVPYEQIRVVVTHLKATRNEP
jgi:hypothetical protein